MFLGDKTLKSAGEKIEYTPKMVEEYIKCKEDIIYFAEKYVYINTIDHGQILPKLWTFQKKVLKVFVDPNSGLPESNKNKRHTILLAARQISKCVHFSTKIKVKNKKTGEINEISIGRFFFQQKILKFLHNIINTIRQVIKYVYN